MNSPVKKSNYQVSFYFINEFKATDLRVSYVMAPDIIQAVTLAYDAFTNTAAARFPVIKIEVS